jgi:hypothetical protein
VGRKAFDIKVVTPNKVVIAKPLLFNDNLANFFTFTPTLNSCLLALRISYVQLINTRLHFSLFDIGLMENLHLLCVFCRR